MHSLDIHGKCDEPALKGGENIKRLDKDFFVQDAYIVAQQLIGKYICRNIDGEVKKYKITQTECYIGTQDTACHASKAKTPRTEIMWQEGGVCYVYLCYGIHQMLNFVTGEKNNPQGVLIRGVEKAQGPGRAAKLLGIDKTFKGENVVTSKKIWVETDFSTSKFSSDKRIGIAYADKKDQDKLWRFTLK